jgi:hypothetical protein
MTLCTPFKSLIGPMLVMVAISLGWPLWEIDIPWVHQRSKRPHERPRGPIIRKVILSWA